MLSADNVSDISGSGSEIQIRLRAQSALCCTLGIQAEINISNSAESDILLCCTEEDKFDFRPNVMRMLINKTNCFSKIMATDGSGLIVYRSGFCFDIIQSDKGQVYNKLPTSLPGLKSADIGAKPLLLRIFDKTGSWGNAGRRIATNLRTQNI